MSAREEALTQEINSLLLEQKRNLGDYCLFLESMIAAIASQDEEKIREATEIDKSYTDKIASRQKIIRSYKQLLQGDGVADSQSLEREIAVLRDAALVLQDRNRERLDAEMALVKNEIMLVKKSIQERKRFPTSFSGEPRYIDIQS